MQVYEYYLGIGNFGNSFSGSSINQNITLLPSLS